MKDFQTFDYLVIDQDEALLPEDSWYVGIHNLGDWDKDEVLYWFPTEKDANDFAEKVSKNYRVPIQTGENQIFDKSDIINTFNDIIGKSIENNKLDYLVSLDHFSMMESIIAIDVKTSFYNVLDNLIYHITPVLEIQSDGEKHIVEAHLIYQDLPWEQNSTINVITKVINGVINKDYIDLREEELHEPLLINNQDDDYESHDDILSSIIALELISEMNIWSSFEGNNKLYSKLHSIIKG